MNKVSIVGAKDNINRKFKTI
jgi:hypothetical protein